MIVVPSNKLRVAIYAQAIFIPITLGIISGLEFGTKYLAFVCVLSSMSALYFWRTRIRGSTRSTFILFSVSVFFSILAYAIDWKIGKLLVEVILD